MFKIVTQSSVAKKKKQATARGNYRQDVKGDVNDPNLGVRVHRDRVPQSKKVLLFYSPFLPAPLNQLALPATSPTKPLQTNGQEVVFLMTRKERTNRRLMSWPYF